MLPGPPTTLSTTLPDVAAAPTRVPSESQRAAIEAKTEPMLVLAGPGAGKTFCLIERIRYLLEIHDVAAERICAFTFTNKAAGEIAERLERTLGERAGHVRTGTIHAFCAELLREFGTRIGLERGFGIADDSYQRAVLRRLGYPPQYCANLLSRFTARRFRDERFAYAKDAEIFDRYERFLEARRMVDFDSLVIRTAELLQDPGVVQRVRARWDCILVDEFQDLNPYQYQVVREIGRDHGHIFAVGDEEQSIYSWAGANPQVFKDFLNDFTISTKVSLRENRRCPREILGYARKLVENNPSLFDERKQIECDRDVPGCISALTFRDDEAELAWVIDDLRRAHEQGGVPWGEMALLYRRHEIGDAAEGRFLAAGLPCRLAQGRALSEDPVVAYLIAALRVVVSTDEFHEENFLREVLPSAVLDVVRTKAEEAKLSLRQQLGRNARELPRTHGDGRKIRRAFYALNNIRMLGQRHRSLVSFVEELLAQRIGQYRSILEEHHHDLSDPAAHEEVVRLAEQLRGADGRRIVWLPRMRGVEIALKGMLTGVGIGTVSLDPIPPAGALCIDPDAAPTLGLPLAMFKALQLLRTDSFPDVFRDFTAVDVETTDKELDRAEVVDIAAVRVRDGQIVEEFHSLVRPRGRIAPAATRVHGISDEDVAGAPTFEAVWPRFEAFCGDDMLVAHNGYEFDFPLLRRLSGKKLRAYDTLPLARELHDGSAKQEDLARHFGIDPGRAHRALDDTRTLARLCLVLNRVKVTLARKTSLVELLDYLGLGLALSREEGDDETMLLRRFTRAYALGRFSECLDYYEMEREKAGDNSLPTLHEVIEWLGGEKTMQRVRAEKTADQRYPQSMSRLRRLLAQCGRGALIEQIADLLERIALSRADGADPDRERVNLLTLHSTKGLEFSRVYIIGVEDAQLPGSSPKKPGFQLELEEARRLLYVGMTRAKEMLVLTHAERRAGKPSGAHRFLDEMGLAVRRIADH
jgi:superfamily I DNA/RNA helicase